MRKIFLRLPAAVSAVMIITGMTMCRSNESSTSQITRSGLDPETFVSVYEGDSTALYTLKNKDMEVCITNFGGRIVSLTVPDRDSVPTDVVLGLNNVEAYFPENNQTDFGASVGRYANRIARGRFVMDGDTVVLPQNNFGHCLHGGPTGWQYKVYEAEQPNDTTLVLTMHSPDGDNGFPGNMTATVTYTLRPDNALAIDYTAVTDRKTVVNLTNHSYFNLSGNPSRSVEDEVLYINADSFTPIDSTYMTTGEIRPVEGTAFDFRTPKQIGADISGDDVQLANGNGYDHNWVLSTGGSDSIPAVVLLSPASGIRMTVYTNEPGVQFYSGNFLDSTVTGKKGIVYGPRAGLALETQHYPDSPNKPAWPSVVLEPGKTYTSRCVYRFDLAK